MTGQGLSLIRRASVNANHMKFTETMHCYPIREPDKAPYTEQWTIEQPFFYWLRARIVSKFDRATYKLPLFKNVWSTFIQILDETIENRHQKSCNNDCGTVYRSLPGDPPGRFEMTPDRAEKACTRMPLDVAWDCRVYDIIHKKQTILTRH